MKKLLPPLILIFILGCSSKIRSITEFSKNDGALTRNRVAEFDKKGNKVLERYFGNPRSNRIIRTTYEEGRKIQEVHCDYFEQQDTCVTREFLRYQYQPEKNLRTETMYESDSAIRFIREYHEFEDLEVVKTRSWEMFPSKDPDPEKAMKLIDSVFYDSKGREVRRLHYNEDFKREPWMETYTYTDSGYTLETTGTGMDTVRFYGYTEYDELTEERDLDFEFRDTISFKYEIDHY